ncbi:vacuolar membrane protein, putative [Candida dubliniensis CD36]|uniref:Vacuolar membrane protein, putative n=1 Tax=Candida dubliniensis (strain CD36 / ATCC MYA-646 / CBS 7987 / NCPF 3949 / NRRL Y-17841) TaxID=573826 RepID=B9WAG7_CANDC|nr:vacuolar membrane protein, putative [Candida dubliniensis CD36]CAX43387.1 vacuolar membrane protein, putative [Candida dubliniensis CD36]
MGCGELLSVPLVFLSLFSNENVPFYKTENATSSDDVNDGKCELIGTFSLMTQAILGMLCLSSLLIKRFYEYPIRRTWPVWIFDVSKQLIGALGVHIFNVILSMVKTAPEIWLIKNNISDDGDNDNDNYDDSGDTKDPCDWYFLNIVLDCTIGVYILYHVFKTMNKICQDYWHITQIESGEYGPNPNKPSTKAFLKQLMVYFTSLMITKIILYGLVECFENQLLWFTSHILLIWLNEYPDEFEIFIVMFIVPIIMNCLQLILIDNFIRNQMWININKRMRLEFPNFSDETESVQQQDIIQAQREEEEQQQKQKLQFSNNTIQDGNNYSSSSSNSDSLLGESHNKSNYGTYNDV